MKWTLSSKFDYHTYSRVKRKMRATMGVLNFVLVLCLHLFLIVGVNGAEEDCPWHKDPRTSAIIKSHCLCARNPTANNQLSVQCQGVEALQIIASLTANRAGVKEPLELLYLNASKLTDANGQVPPRIFRDVKMVSLQISACGIKSIHPEAFRGQEAHLKHLSLTMNQLSEVPKPALERLRQLGLLDMSYNKLTKIPNGVFDKLNKLSTLKLNDNNLELESFSFRGLENSLRNLNLKGTRVSVIPEAISNLSSLAFLDLAQNRLRDLDSHPFLRLHSLTALNLERNLLQTLPTSVFTGVNDTLSSLSLLNNLITHFPKEALHSLRELRVLDLGFNLLTEIPSDAFFGLNSLTLLALDGNPLTTLPMSTFTRLNSTLRGLSLGGRFLSCDCRIKWVLDWIREYDLQVTSRERSPQFCGSPQPLRSLNFYQLKSEDLKCEGNEGTKPILSTTKTTDYDLNLSPADLAVLGLNSEFFIPGNEDSEEKTGKSPSKSPGKSKNPGEDFVDSVETQASSNEKSQRQQYSAPENYETEEETDNLPADSDPVQNTQNKPSSTTPFSSTKPSNSISTATTTKKTLQRIKPFAQPSTRPKIQPQPKIVTSTTTSVSSSSSSTSTAQMPVTEIKVHVGTGRIPEHGSTPRVIQGHGGRKPSLILDTIDIDDSKIPVIAGVGPRVTSSPSGSVISVRGTLPPSTTYPPTPRPTPLPPHLQVTGASSIQSGGRPPNLIFAEKSEILLKDIERLGDSVVLQWESQKQTGFRIIYRLFGEDTFRHGPPLAATEREYQIQNIPRNECVVVCVVPYEEILYNEINPSAASIPPGSQCREMKPMPASALMNHMDKITIGASAAICCTVLLAVLIFIGLTRRAKNRRPPPSIIAKIPPGSFVSPSPGPAPVMITNGSANLIKEWDQMSAMSARSIPRARVYHGTMDGPPLGMGPVRAILPLSHNHSSQRSIPDGNSTHRSYLSNHHAHHSHSMHSYAGQPPPAQHNGHSTTSAAVSTYLNNQSRLLRASMGSRSSQDALNKQLGPSAQLHRHFEQNKRRRHPRHSQSDSLNTLSGYETPDNWTDHDQDVYMARNPTRHDLVQL